MDGKNSLQLQSSALLAKKKKGLQQMLSSGIAPAYNKND